MHAVDSNVVVRYLTGDDPEQAAKARAVIGILPVFVSRTVLLEVEWVLRTVYGFPAPSVTSALRSFAGLPGVVVEDAGLVATALNWADAGMDFADALHLSAATGCEQFLTFGKRLIRVGTRVSKMTVSEP